MKRIFLLQLVESSRVAVPERKMTHHTEPCHVLVSKDAGVALIMRILADQTGMTVSQLSAVGKQNIGFCIQDTRRYRNHSKCRL